MLTEVRNCLYFMRAHAVSKIKDCSSMKCMNNVGDIFKTKLYCFNYNGWLIVNTYKRIN